MPNPEAKSPGCFQLLPMRGGKKIRIAFYLLAAGGAALFTFLLIRQGAPHVIAAFASAGWWIAAVAIYHLAVPVFLDAIAWWALFPKSERLSLWQLFWMRWIGESVSTLVPSATVGGDVVRARLAALHGAPIPTAAASVLVDITLGVFVQIVFTLFGLGLIVSATGQQGFVRPTLIGAVIGVLAIIGFYVVQRLGMFRFIGKMISRLANADDWHSLVHSGHTPRPGDSQALCAAVRCDRMLRSDGHLATGRIRRNLDRAPRTCSASDARQRGDLAKHGSGDPFGSVSRAGRPWRAGGRLRRSLVICSVFLVTLRSRSL